MITFADLGPVPTVHLFLRVPVPLPSGGWSWGELPQYKGVLAREYAYTAKECEALVNTWGRMAAEIACRKERVSRAERFRILAKGPVTGFTLGLREWVWSPKDHTWLPDGEYLCGWRLAARAYFEKTGEIIERKKFDASVRPPLLSAIPTPPGLRDRGPHVRSAKEDVPHEGALPNLWGLRAG